MFNDILKKPKRKIPQQKSNNTHITISKETHKLLIEQLKTTKDNYRFFIDIINNKTKEEILKKIELLLTDKKKAKDVFEDNINNIKKILKGV